MINIIGGLYKRTNLSVPMNDVRPTSSQKREAIFSILESNSLKNSYILYKNKCFIDLFAGSGSLGLEAISRGANYCYFYEKNDYVISNLEKNCLKICKNNNYQIISGDIHLSNFEEINLPISTIFIDPPYAIKDFKLILNKLNVLKNLNIKTNIVIESHINTKIIYPQKFKLFKEKKIGISKITFLKVQN